MTSASSAIDAVLETSANAVHDHQRVHVDAQLAMGASAALNNFDR